MRLVPILSLLLPGMVAATCLPVNGDRILGRDLAMADPQFSRLPATLQLASAPVAGMTRVFALAELRQIARANGIGFSDGSEICFEVPMRVPSDADFIESMRQSLPKAATLQLVDRGRAAIPAGRIEFPLSSLEPPAAGVDGAQLWRGFVQYTDTRRIAVWARVTVTMSYAAVVPRKNLPADTSIDIASLQLETKTGPLRREPVASRIEDVAGRVVRRPVSAGAEIPISLLDEPPAVRRGESVKVEVQSGSALLRFDAIAETTAHAGEFADFRNPVSGKTFRARAEAGSRAVVIVGQVPVL